ncbi:expressed unknown protein [Seminavis robusta]|uniref:Uncharacterized protein n=1 Tax=Seminavis robusta TaxID=568900 RepID=A0A9N8HHK7_9STRA|nr:expressed unknown protein [Seminavis robusta]|eukprot:Sro541_g163110.1 n/a (733) ;mRNA; r:7406-9935
MSTVSRSAEVVATNSKAERRKQLLSQLAAIKQQKQQQPKCSGLLPGSFALFKLRAASQSSVAPVGIVGETDQADAISLPEKRHTDGSLPYKKRTFDSTGPKTANAQQEAKPKKNKLTAEKPLPNLKIMKSILNLKGGKKPVMKPVKEKQAKSITTSTNPPIGASKGSPAFSLEATGASSSSVTLKAKSSPSPPPSSSKSAKTQSTAVGKAQSTAATVGWVHPAKTAPAPSSSTEKSVVSLSSNSAATSTSNVSSDSGDSASVVISTNSKTAGSPTNDNQQRRIKTKGNKNGEGRIRSKASPASSSGSVSTTTTTSSSSTRSKGGLPSPYDVKHNVESSFALFNDLAEKVFDPSSPIRLLANTIASSSLLWRDIWLTGEVQGLDFGKNIEQQVGEETGSVHAGFAWFCNAPDIYSSPSTFFHTPQIKQSFVLCLNVRLIAKAEAVLLSKLVKDLSVETMVKEFLSSLSPGASEQYPKTKKGRLDPQNRNQSKCLLFLARLHCALLFLGKSVDEVDKNLLSVVQKCLAIVEEFASLTPKKKRGRKLKDTEEQLVVGGTLEGEGETDATTVAPTPDNTPRRNVRRVSVQSEGEGEGLALDASASTGPELLREEAFPKKRRVSIQSEGEGLALEFSASSATALDKEEASPKKRKARKRAILEDSDSEDSVGFNPPPKKKRRRVSVDSFPALEELVAANMSVDEEIKNAVELQTYFQAALKILQRRQQALALLQNNY